MFIAVINENFDIAEEAKRGEQTDHYLQNQTQGSEKTWPAWIYKLNPYRWFKPSPRAIAVANLPSNLVLPMQKALVQGPSLSMPERRPTRVSFPPFFTLFSSDPLVSPRSGRGREEGLCVISRTGRLIYCSGCSSAKRNQTTYPSPPCGTRPRTAMAPRPRTPTMRKRQTGTCAS